MNKKLLLLVSVLVAALLFAACNGDDEEPEAEGSPSSSASESASPSDGPSAAEPVTEEEGEVVSVRYNVWDDTESNPPSAPQLVVEGEDPWDIDLSEGAAVEKLGGFEVGATNSFTIYPDGPDGAEIEVEVPVEDLPKTGEALDVVIYIEDDLVIVDAGLIGFNEEFPREG